jgi:YegS/Rv2252/BmrU family lipid kinase
MEKIIVIINPISGTASKKHILELLNQYVSPDKFERQIFYTRYRGHAFEIAGRAIEDKADCVIAVGGDGTVNEVAKALIHTSSVLGIVPMGSGNGLARDLFIPMEPRKALDVILERNITAIDYCKANEHIFFCTCGVGFDALVSERFAGEKRRGFWTYLKSAITEFSRFKPDTYDLIFENEVLTKSAFLVTCANASQYGNNAFIAPQANMNDGMMDIAVLSPITPFDVGPLIVQMFTKQMMKNSKTEYYRAQKMTIRREKSGVMHIDGEPVPTGETITIETFRSGLQVIVPHRSFMSSYPHFFGAPTNRMRKK